MTATVITVQTMKGPFDSITADSADFTFAASSGSSGDAFTCGGRDIALVYNSGSVAGTVTITSAADERGRTGDITTYSMAAGDYASFGVGLTNAKGWQDANRKITLTLSAATMKVAVLRLPTGFPA